MTHLNYRNISFAFSTYKRIDIKTIQNWYWAKMLQETRIIFLLARKELISAGILPSTVHIKVKKAKGPIYFHFTKQFQPLDSVDEIRSCQTSSSSISSIEFKRTWDQELRKLRKRDKKQSSPTCSKGCISVACARAPVSDLLYTHATSWLFCASHRGFEDFQSAGITPKQPGPSNEDM